MVGHGRLIQSNQTTLGFVNRKIERPELVIPELMNDRNSVLRQVASQIVKLVNRFGKIDREPVRRRAFGTKRTGQNIGTAQMQIAPSQTLRESRQESLLIG